MNQPPSIKKNYLYNTAFTIASFLFPIITFPYVARVLGPVYIGKVAFAESIVAYFALFASLGIPLYGIREVAKVRDDKTALNRVFSELFIINVAAMGISALLFLSLFFLIEKIRAEEVLFLVLGINIILGAFSIEWLYKGLENYQYITLRSLFFKLISLGLLFLLVRSQGDYVWFAGISVLALSGANILNMINSKKYVKLTLKDIQLKKHIKPILVIFSTTIAISLYINLDKVMLGFLAGDEYVGLYTAASKMNRIVLSVITSLGTVLIPRMSYYLESNRMAEFDLLSKRSLDFIFSLAIPAMVGMILLSNEIMLLFAGPQYTSAVLTTRIMAPIILLIGLSTFFSLQILIPSHKEIFVLYITLSAAITDIALNFLLIPRFYHNGAAIATVSAELIAMMLNVLFIKKLFPIKILSRKTFELLLISLSFIPVVLFIKHFSTNYIFTFSLSILLCMSIYVIVSFKRKYELMMNIYTQVRSYF